MNSVFLIDNKPSLTEEDIVEYINRLGIYDSLAKARNILIKPNFAAGSYVSADSNVVTDLGLLKKLIDAILRINHLATVYVAESDSTGFGFAYQKFENFGLLEMLSNHRVKLLDLSRDHLVSFDVSNSKYFLPPYRPLWMSREVMNADFLVSISNLKTHSITRYTGACKNLFGLLPVMRKEEYHPYIDRVIHDLVKVKRIDLSIVDGFVGMQKNGPVQGEKTNFSFRVFSSDPVIADIVSCKKVGINWRSIKYLRYLSENVEIKATVEEIGVVEGSRIIMPGKTLRFFNFFGLMLQRMGQGLANYGHRLHTARSFFEATIITLSPLLIRIFGLQRLKRWKARLTKND